MEVKQQKTQIKKAKKLREHASSKSFEILWNLLKKNSWGHKFLQKEPIDAIIVDFYCPKLHLAINIDGNMHLPSKDEKVLQAKNITLIRFSSEEVSHFPDLVEIHIAKVIEKMGF